MEGSSYPTKQGYTDSGAAPGGGSSQAYGSGGATGRFDFISFIKKPQVILRIICLVFAIVVFGCINSQGYEHEKCQIGEPGACGYGIFVGASAFVVLSVFLVLDFVFDNISNVMHRKYIVIGDILVSGLWTFLYFVCSCYLTDVWRKADKTGVWGRSDIEAAIAFSFFSIGTFGALVVLAVLRYRQGISEDFSIRADSGYPSDPYAGADGQSSP